MNENKNYEMTPQKDVDYSAKIFDDIFAGKYAAQFPGEHPKKIARKIMAEMKEREREKQEHKSACKKDDKTQAQDLAAEEHHEHTWVQSNKTGKLYCKTCMMIGWQQDFTSERWNQDYYAPFKPSRKVVIFTKDIVMKDLDIGDPRRQKQIEEIYQKFLENTGKILMRGSPKKAAIGAIYLHLFPEADKNEIRKKLKISSELLAEYQTRLLPENQTKEYKFKKDLNFGLYKFFDERLPEETQDFRNKLKQEFDKLSVNEKGEIKQSRGNPKRELIAKAYQTLRPETTWATLNELFA